MDNLEKLLFICVLAITFLTGLLSSYALNSAYINTEKPFLIGFGNNKEQPGNWVLNENIEIYHDKVILYVNEVSATKYAATGSMLPTLGENATGLRIKPASPEQIQIGDIISFEQDDKVIVHRVIAKGQDLKGYYFITKGDNNQETDGKIYWEQVRYVTIGLIY